MNKNLNLVFSADNNYAQQLCAAIVSLAKTNSNEFDSINIAVIDNGISSQNKDFIKQAVYDNPKIIIKYFPFELYRKKLKLNMAWEISVSSYGRLFIGSMLPVSWERVLYLDCDMITCASIKVLWETDLRGNVLGAVQDAVGKSVKSGVSLTESDPYFNAGLLLVDLDRWRDESVEKRCLQFLDNHNGMVIHHDQGILNYVLKNRWYRLPLEYNLMTVHFFFDKQKILKYYNDYACFYSDQEINAAISSPTIIHFTPSFTTRPWENGCRHPLRAKYFAALEDTAWRDYRPKRQKLTFVGGGKWVYNRLLDWRYRNLPF